MAKTYKVWIEIEEYDDETDEHTDVEDTLPFAASAHCDTLAEAESIAIRLHNVASSIIRVAEQEEPTC